MTIAWPDIVCFDCGKKLERGGTWEPYMLTLCQEILHIQLCIECIACVEAARPRKSDVHFLVDNGLIPCEEQAD